MNRAYLFNQINQLNQSRYSKNTSLFVTIGTGIALSLFPIIALASTSTVNGTLSANATSTGSSSVVTGTIGGGTTSTSSGSTLATSTNTISGTVVGGGSSGGGGGGGSGGSSGSSGGGGGGGNGSPSMYGMGGGGGVMDPYPGQVLGASTSTNCGPLLHTYMRQQNSNDTNEVMKLQAFLNVNLSLSLPISGLFGATTENAVNIFQIKYKSEVLAPWVPYGLPSDTTATGYVYKTTQRKINLLYCPSLYIPSPQLP